MPEISQHTNQLPAVNAQCIVCELGFVNNTGTDFIDCE